MSAKAVFAVVVSLCLVLGSVLGVAPASAEEPNALGHIPMSEEEFNAKLITHPVTRLPDSWDWRWDYVTVAKNQGGCGSCWAMACIATMESRALLTGWPELDLSEQFGVSCWDDPDNGGCCGGNSGLFGFFEDNWAVNEAEFVYQAGDADGPRVCPGDTVFNNWPLVPCPPGMPFGPTNLHVVDWWTIANDVDQLKEELYNNGPFYVAYTVMEDFDDYWAGSDPLPAYQHSYGNVRGGHAVLLVGWIDDEECWIARNSWGATGGPENNGCFYINWDSNCGFGDGAAACSIEGLTVVSPNGGEVLHAGCDYIVSWVSEGAGDYVRIRLSKDGGNSYMTLADHVANTGSHSVRMPCEETTEARILVADVDDSGFWDISDEDFEIAFPTITVDADVDEVYDPPNPWTQDGLVIDFFEVSSDADLYNIHFVADPLQDPSVPCEPGHTKMISGDLVEFVPEVINYLEAGDVATIEIKVVVPVGQHTGDYEGLVHVLAEPGCGCSSTISEDFEAAIEVEDETDVDFADDRGNVSRDLTLHLVGAKLDDVSGTITVVNPDSDENNADMADGPGNVRIERIDTEISDLVKVGDPAVTIPESAITLLGDFDSLASGEADEIEVMVSIPDGIPVNATYMGTVTLDYESCLGGQEVSDTFTIMLEVLQTQGTLDIVASEVNLDFCFDPPWLAPGEVVFDFDIMANGDHRNIRVSTGGLEHPTLPTKLEDFAFFPEEIAFLAAGETRTVGVIVTIPIGQHSGLYSGYIQVVSENGGEDQVLVTIDICSEYDLDIRDNYANLSGNVMEVSCTARANQSGGEWALRAFDIGLPDEVANNYDDFDGPGNAPIECVTYEFGEWSYLWQNDDQGHNYHLDKVFTGEGSVIGELCGWSSGEFRRLLVAIFVPKMTGNDNHPGTYKGRLDCWANIDDADAEVAHDFFDIEVHLSREVGHAPEGDGESDFGGYPDDGGARLYWGRFDQLGLTGDINLYRADTGSGDYTRINSAPLAASSDYLDTAIEAGTEYDYRLGIGSSGGPEIFIGPVAVGGAPKFCHLSQNAPNPFRSGTEISYELPSRTHVSLRVYDVSGRLVRVLKEGEQPAGYYTSVWDRRDERGKDVASGVYFYRYATPQFEETRKMVVLH